MQELRQEGDWAVETQGKVWHSYGMPWVGRALHKPWGEAGTRATEKWLLSFWACTWEKGC